MNDPHARNRLPVSVINRGKDMIHRRMSSIGCSRVIALTGLGLVLMTGSAVRLHAADYANFPVVKPVMSCEQLVQADIKAPGGAKISIKTATIRQTDKGSYCTVSGSIEPGYSVQGNLPIEHWTQRFLMGGFGQASGCTAAMNGEFAVASGGFGGYSSPNADTDPSAAAWGVTPQARINNAYLSNHMTVVAFKAVIKAFYGEGPRFSYMTGCSIGGWQVLQEAQRFPEDFDGYSVGAPPIYQTVHDLGFWHGWEYKANKRADGSVVLSADKLPILHDAALKHCAAVSGIIDDDLQQPTACKFEKSWVQCPASVSGASNCLTVEEADVAEQLYLGPNDGKGHFFEVSGWPPGSELQWKLSTTGKPADNEGLAPHGIHSFLMPPLSGKSTEEIMAQYSFTQEFLDKTIEMRPLYNATNTNLRRLAKLGGKIILWNGAEDTTVQPATSLSYYEGVRKEMGAKETDNFLRFFLLPGVGHCGGGDSANQVDILTPLMAWVENRRAPEVIVAGKPVQAVGGQGGQGGQNAGGGPGALGAPGGQGGGPGGPGGGQPYAQTAKATVSTRPIYPYPNVAKYKGTGDPNDAANYLEVKGPAPFPQAFTNETSDLLGPDNQKFYKAENGKLEEAPKP